MKNPSLDDQVLDDFIKRFGQEKGKILLRKFLESMQDCTVNLKKAFAEKDNVLMHRMAHNLKSTCGNVGAIHGQSMAVEIEKAIKKCMDESKQPFSDQHSIDNLLKELEFVQEKIQSQRL